MPFRSSLARSVGKLLEVWKDRDLSLRGDIQSSRYITPPLSATGGNQSSPGGFTGPNGYTYHVFTSPGTLVVTANSGPAYYLVVAGGGSGGFGNGAGGGAGGLRSNDPTVPSPSTMKVTHTFTLSPGTYPITVGDGGTAPEDNGSESNIGGTTVIASGGGWGGDNKAGNPGGSGGGGTPPGYGSAISATDPLTPQLQGHNGGIDNNGGGGGGAGGVAGPNAENGDKLDIPAYNTTQITPTGITMPAGWIAYVGAPGGYGGGGAGHDGNPTSHNQAAAGSDQGIANTGGGGDEGPGVNGGSGIVIIRYQ